MLDDDITKSFSRKSLFFYGGALGESHLLTLISNDEHKTSV